MPSNVRFLGTSDEVDTCDCCGRKNLKSTVALSIDEADPVHFGVVCAARALSRSAKEIRANARAADLERAEQERRDRQAAHEAESAPWFAFLRTHGTGSDTFRQIESLGGYAVARARYEASRSAGL